MSYMVVRPSKAGVAKADVGARIAIAALMISSSPHHPHSVILYAGNENALTSNKQKKTHGTRNTTTSRPNSDDKPPISERPAQSPAPLGIKQ